MEKQKRTLSQLKREAAVLKRAIRNQQRIVLANVERANLLMKLDDLRRFNAGEIDGNPYDFLNRPIEKPKPDPYH
jgi:hypothetical protein